MDATAWVPIRWPCGPLEIERVKAVPGVTTSDVEALRQWSEPALLDRIAGSPVSCLVVPWAEGSERDGEHQRSLVPLLAAARQRGLALVGWSGEKADTRRARQAARDERDAHRQVVDDRAEVVERDAVGPHDDEVLVLDVGRRDDDGARP